MFPFLASSSARPARRPPRFGAQVVPEAWRPWVTINVLVATVMILAEGARPDLTFFGSIFALTALDVLAAKEAFAGLSSTGLQNEV